VKKIKQLKQSSRTILGCCYGYSYFWSRGKLELPETTPELELNDEIELAQFFQVLPSGKSEWIPDVTIDWNKTAIEDNLKKLLVNNNDAVVLKYFGLVGGHALAIKKIDNDLYEFFDCNDGIYSFTSSEFGEIINKITDDFYGKFFYGFGMEKISADENFHPSIIKNTYAAAYLFCARLLTLPIGIGRLVLSFFEYINKQSETKAERLSLFFKQESPEKEERLSQFLQQESTENEPLPLLSADLG